jgi:hypothetical protein
MRTGKADPFETLRSRAPLQEVARMEIFPSYFRELGPAIKIYNLPEQSDLFHPLSLQDLSLH